MSHNHFLIALVLSLFSVGEMFAQSPITEKRIYLVDLTGSMEGRGNVPTPNILQTVKDNLEETINNIEDTATEIQIVPFTNKIGKDIISGRISEKESILSSIRSLHTLSGDTNIADAWSYGVSLLDSTKINYLFLLTDGLHNNGPTKEELFDRLRTWGSMAKGKYMYAFYVMLTPNAKESEICEIIDSTDNMWLIESMNLNTSLVRTSINTRKNVFSNHTASLSFLSNNKNADLNNLGLSVTVEDNDYYDIQNVTKSPVGDIYSFDIVEKRPKLQMPLDTTLTLHFSYDTLANPFVFLTPDKVDFQIVNQGPRTISITVAKNKKGLSDLNLKKLKYKEPFQGFFRWTRELYEPYFDLPFLSKPDTASTVSTLILSWNEEAVRAGSSIKIDLSTEDSEYGDHVIVTNGNLNDPFIAKSGQDTLLLHTKVIPGIPSTQFSGDVWAITDKIDSVNDEELTSNSIKLGSWRLQYKKSWPFWIWLFWVLLTVLVNIATFFIIKWTIKFCFKLIAGIFKSVSELFNSFISVITPKRNVPSSKLKDAKKMLQERDNSSSSSIKFPKWKLNIQKRTGWSNDIIDNLRSKEEAEIYIKANLREAIIGGRSALIRSDIDWSDYPCKRNKWLKGKLADYDNWIDYNNADLIGEGFPPRDFNGDPIELHHIGQRQDSPFAELRWHEHMGDGNNRILHEMGKESEIDRGLFDKEKSNYWRARFQSFTAEELAHIYN